MTTRNTQSLQFVRGAIAIFLALLIAGCAGGFAPKPVKSVPFLERSQTQSDEGVRVTVAVPNAREARELFGISLYRKRIQPVWLEIENSTDSWVAFMPAGVDREYHSPMEVAAINRNDEARDQAEKYFFQNGLHPQIAPGVTRSGFVFTNLDEGTKAFNVDIFGDSSGWQFTFFVQVPGLAVDHYDFDYDNMYPPEQITDFTDDDAFVEALGNLPCCTVDAKGENKGDPLNLVFIGTPSEVYYAVIRAGWDETETVTAASGFKTAMSFITGGEYRYSPVSSLYVFDRSQDIALQKIRKNIHERNHFRLWLAPMTFHGKPVWIGQISRDIGVRFTTKTITTHKIDPDVDETREFLLENLAYSDVVDKLAYVNGVGEAAIDSPRQNLTGDPYFTDGLRLVVWLASEPSDITDIEFVPWVNPNN